MSSAGRCLTHRFRFLIDGLWTRFGFLRDNGSGTWLTPWSVAAGLGWFFGGRKAVEGAGDVGGAGCGGTALSGRAGGPERAVGHRCGPALWGVAADGALLAAAVCRGWWAGQPG